MLNVKRLALAALLLATATAAQASSYTYKYVGPTFTASTNHLEITFTTSAPLAPSTSYLSTTTANVISGTVSVFGPTGAIVQGLQLPITNFQVHTNAAASGTVPGIDSWDIFGEINNTTGVAPTMTGSDLQAYSINTLAFIPGSDIPGATGLVTGAYDYEQGTLTTFYASCTGVTGCTLAGNGQPYVGNYGGIINPSNTSAANWTLNGVTTQPVPTPVALTGSLPDGVLNTSYSASLTATGGTPPYSWTATGLPTGVSINASTGVVSGTPSAAGSYSTTVTVTDAQKSTASVSGPVVISAPMSCTVPGNSQEFQNKGKITKVGAGYIVVGTVVVQTSSCTKVEWNGAKGFAIGQVAESEGFSYGGANYALKITIN